MIALRPSRLLANRLDIRNRGCYGIGCSGAFRADELMWTAIEQRIEVCSH